MKIHLDTKIIVSEKNYKEAMELVYQLETIKDSLKVKDEHIKLLENSLYTKDAKIETLEKILKLKDKEIEDLRKVGENETIM